MTQIHVILELGTDGYGVWFQELPNVFGFGKTVEEAKADAKALLQHIDGMVTKTALSKTSGINATQLCHYSSGLKKPKKEQHDKIILGLHQIGRDLLAIS